MDDILIQGPDWPTTIDRARVILQRCRDNNVSLSLKKAKCGHSVPFAGMIITSKGVSPDPEMVSGIAKFPVPKNVTDVKSFLGLTQQFASYIPDLAHAAEGLHMLLKKGVEFLWTEEQQRSFDCVKSLLTSPLWPKSSDAHIASFTRYHRINIALITG